MRARRDELRNRLAVLEALDRTDDPGHAKAAVRVAPSYAVALTARGEAARARSPMAATTAAGSRTAANTPRVLRGPGGDRRYSHDI
mmetsp:Transcript_28430/g.83468  ORF Transcript_28430/g.83468 Transcript_28430/m.83468 type:complete len:86 (-) Transcript_28430:84-341(-)